jgi:hypothetical protein
MAFIPGDWTITRNGEALDVRYIGDVHDNTGTNTPNYITTIELHRALQDFADDEQSTGDDELSIIDQTPSDRGGADTNITLLNGCNIDDNAAQYIYDGSLTQDDGDTFYDGIQVFGNSTNIQIIQNGARIVDDFWNNLTMRTATGDAASGTTHRFLVKTRTGGADIDGRRLLGTQRELGTVYTEFFIGGGTNRGNNVLALTANSDLNNPTAAGTIAGWDTITNTVEGYTQITVGGTAYNFYSDWEFGVQSANDVYERAKWIQARVANIGVDTPARDADQTLYGLPGDIFRGITHSITLTDLGTGAWVEPEQVTWGTGATAGVGQLLAIDSTTSGTATEMWIQLLSGVAPTGTITSDTNGATATTGTVTPKQVSLPFIGASTGSAIIGAYGLGIGNDDLSQNERLIDLADQLVAPPNNVSYSVSNLVNGDYILTGNASGQDFDFTQLTTSATYNSAGVTSIVMTAPIPTDIPSSGTFRLELDTGSWKRVVYTSFSGSTFTIPSTDFSGTQAATAGNNAFVSYLDKVVDNAPVESVTFVYSAPRTVFTRVRNANPGVEIKTFETTSVIGTGGGSSTVGRINDF